MFVRTNGTRFELEGKPFTAAGVNCYFLGYCSSEVRRPMLASIRAAGLTTVRAWAFLDGAAPVAGGQPVFQYESGGEIRFHDGPGGLERLDGLIADAEREGLRLILPFVNHWADFGGAPQYLKWLGISGPVDEFYRQPRAREAYRRWIEHLVTRVNTSTGRIYRDDPTILAWELANEPECPRSRKSLLTEWAEEMSGFVKSLDSNHLVAVGDAGYFGKKGVDSEALVKLGSIDFGTCHLYPDSLGITKAGACRWLERRVEKSRRAGKPVLLEEYGLKIDGRRVRSDEDRDGWYERWLAAFSAAGGAGSLQWMMGSRHAEVAGFHDPYTIYELAKTEKAGPRT